MGRNVLKVRMFGELHITLNDKEMELPGGIYSKTMRLFLLMAYYGEQGISRRETLELLYGDHDYADDSGSLRVAAFRLKKQLVDAGILSKGGTLGGKGMFRLEQEGLETVVDARVFEEKAHKALKTQGQEEQLALLEDVCRMYTGEFLPSLSGEMWVAGKQARFQNLYFQCVQRCLTLLQEKGEYGKMLYLARSVIRLYPYEEWYGAALDALMGMERWKDARETAEKAVKSLMDRMGVRPTEVLEERIRKINRNMSGSAKNLLEIRRQLEETQSDSGAFFCSYQSFVGTYRYEMRKMERTGESLYLILCSLTEKEEKTARSGEGAFEKAVELFGDAIRESLRRADVYTRYGRNQYLMLLEGIRQEDCSMISARIENRFEKSAGAGRYRIHHFIAPVVAGGEPRLQDSLTFRSGGWDQ